MSVWPKSIPDYRWPRELLSPRRLPARLAGAAIFHAAHLAGRCVGFIRGNRPAVLVIRTDGIGDAVLAEPMMESLEHKFPGSALHIWAPPATCELFRAVPYIARRLAIPRGYREGNLAVFEQKQWRGRIGYRLGRWIFSTVVYVAHNPEPLGNWLLASARAKDRWYAPGNTENQFDSQRAGTAARASLLIGMPQETGNMSHELSRNAAIARHWEADIGGRSPTIHIDETALRQARRQERVWRQVASWLSATAVVGVMPAASAAVKKYPARHWASAMARLWREHHIICALLGGENDAADIAEVEAHLGRTPRLRMAAPMDLPAMAGLIGSLDGLISVDTGLAHISLAQDVPTVILVGGSHPGRFFPWPNFPDARPLRSVVLNQAMPCAGCGGRCHLKEAECITRVLPQSIVTAIASLLGSPAIPLRAAS